MKTTATPAETTTNNVVMVVVFIIIYINFMQGIDNYMPEIYHVLEDIVLQLFCIYNLCYM